MFDGKPNNINNDTLNAKAEVLKIIYNKAQCLRLVS